MANVAVMLEQMGKGGDVRFADLARVCESYFGKRRIAGSHHIYQTPWPGDPRVNIQNEGGKAKPYQIK